MLYRPSQHVAVCSEAEITGLIHNSGRVFARINRLSVLLSLSDLGPDALDGGKKLRLVVERCHHDMPPLPSGRVIAVVTGDKAPDGVVLGVNLSHRPKAKPRTKVCTTGMVCT